MTARAFIYLNRGHPKEQDPLWYGDSAGHWDGDTLVVESRRGRSSGSPRGSGQDRVRLGDPGVEFRPDVFAIITSVDLMIASASSPRRSFSAFTASAVMTAVSD